MTIDELIDALERAAGPSRELDAEIAVFIGYRSIPFDAMGSHVPLAMQREWVGGASSNGHWLHRYTESIDAALTLVPETRRTYLTVLETGRAKATCEDATIVFATYANAAIAICIAALRARKP